MRDPINERLRRATRGIGFGTGYDPNPIRATGGMFEGAFDPGMSAPTPSVPEGNSRIQALRGLYNNQGEAMGRYREHMGNMPQYQRPGIGERVTQGLVGSLVNLAGGNRNPMQGVNFAMDRLEEPYRRSMETWANTGEALKTAASIEEADKENRIKAIREELDWENVEQDNRRAEVEAAARIENYGNLETHRAAQRELARERADFDKGYRTKVFQEGVRRFGEQQGLREKSERRQSEHQRATRAQRATALDIQARNATTAERNATARTSGTDSVSITQQVAAEQNAYRYLSGFPQYKDHIESFGTNDYRISPNAPMEVRRAIENDVKEALSQQNINKSFPNVDEPPTPSQGDDPGVIERFMDYFGFGGTDEDEEDEEEEPEDEWEVIE